MNCYNGEEYLGEAIDSVLSQTYRDWELIFWDNCSTDLSREIFLNYDDPRLRYFRSPKHTDLGTARAEAYKKLTGEFVAILDTDDVWLPAKLERQLALFQDSRVGVVICNTLFFSEKKKRVLYGPEGPPVGQVFGELLRSYFVSSETIVFRKSVADSLDVAFDADFSSIADFDLVARLAMVSHLSCVNEVLAKWRVHENSGTWTAPMAIASEKLRWIDKQEKLNPDFWSSNIRVANEFRQSAKLQLAMIYLLNGSRKKCLNQVLRQSPISAKGLILSFLCIAPFGKMALNKYFHEKFLI